MQRISAVDDIFAKGKRVYIYISTNHASESSIKITHQYNHLEAYQINLNTQSPVKMNQTILNKLEKWVSDAKYIYVQNIYNAICILPFYKYKKVITDLHGLVPEEEYYLGNPLRATYFEEIEKFVVYNSFALITVSKPMTQHIKNKYPGLTAKIFNMPITNSPINNGSRKYQKINQNKMTIIYVGGTQSWQNIDKMLSAISKCQTGFNFIIVTKDLDLFSVKIKEFGLVNEIKLISVPQKKIKDLYKQADFGFILRDHSIFNQVACPTKLIEYLSNGIIPIVWQPEIGDFFKWGYSYLTLNDLIKGKIPPVDQLKKMRNNNFRVIKKIQQTFFSSKKELLKFIKKIPLKTNRNDFLSALTEFYEMKYMAQLFIDNGSGFNEEQSILKFIKPGRTEIQFDLNNFHNINGLRFDPVNDMSLIHIESIHIICHNNEILEVCDYRTNALYTPGKNLLFMTRDPQIYLNIDPQNLNKPEKIMIHIDYISIGPTTFQYNLILENLELRKQIEQLKTKTQRQNQMTFSGGGKN